MKISESDFLENWKSAGTSGFFFKPLVLNRIEPYWEIKSFKSSAILEPSLQETSQVFRFLVVISLKSSPAFIETARFDTQRCRSLDGERKRTRNLSDDSPALI
jgi:hypothetical protein